MRFVHFASSIIIKYSVVAASKVNLAFYGEF